jgi:hypothetical protein
MKRRIEPPGEGLLRGADGRIQARKLAAWICFVIGVALLVQGSLQPASVDVQSKIAPAVVALVFSLLFWGLVTVQNIVELVALLKGQGPGSKEAGNDK